MLRFTKKKTEECNFYVDFITLPQINCFVTISFYTTSHLPDIYTVFIYKNLSEVVCGNKIFLRVERQGSHVGKFILLKLNKHAQRRTKITHLGRARATNFSFAFTRVHCDHIRNIFW